MITEEQLADWERDARQGERLHHDTTLSLIAEVRRLQLEAE